MKPTRSTAILLLLALLPACQSPGEGERLHALFDREWEFRLGEDPLLATSVGRNEFNDRLGSGRPKITNDAPASIVNCWRLSRPSIPPASIAKTASASRIFEHSLREDIAGSKFAAYEIPITVDSGFHISFARLPTRTPFPNHQGLRKLHRPPQGLPRLRESTHRQHAAGLVRGMTLPESFSPATS